MNYYNDMIQNSNQNQLDFMINNSSNPQNVDVDNLNGLMKNLTLDNYQNNFFPLNASSNNNNNQNSQIPDSASLPGQNWGMRDDLLNFSLNQPGLFSNQN